MPVRLIKKIYSLCAKLYLADLLIYMAMQSPESDIFYQDINTDDWKSLLGCFNQHVFPDSLKLVKAYQGLYSYLAIANAMMSKQ